jgi:AcrR family transcriptional regulator
VAETLFLRDGYAATSMTRIAAAAAVAEATVYLAFPSKAELLSEIVRVALRGDDREMPIAERRSWQKVLRSSDETIALTFARFNEAILHRAAPVLALAEAAALSDPELSGPRDQGHEGQRNLCHELAHELQARGLLAAGVDEFEATDILFALTGEDPYRRLVHERRWTRRRYVDWLERTVRRTLLSE